MKKVLLVLLTLCFSMGSRAQEKTMAELFKVMPDSLLPYLTTNNRLDMLDFMEANMKAEVTNLLDGKSEMTALAPDSLSIRMNSVLRIDMKVARVATAIHKLFV